MKLLLVLCLWVFATVFCSDKNYEGYKTYEITPKTREQADFLHQLGDDDNNFDFWSEPRQLNISSVVMVAPGVQKVFENQLKEMSKFGLEYRILLENVAEALRKEAKENLIIPRAFGGVSFTRYMTLLEIEVYLARLAKDYPEVVTLQSIGRTYEGRDIWSVRISSGGCKPQILVDAGIHAREWIAPPTAVYIIHQLVENPANARYYTDVDWTIIPVLNPDGYDYTFTHTRLWRANRSPTPNISCIGTDLNRNFGYHWMEAGASPVPCSEVYAGPAAFSEFEAQHLRDYVLSHKDYIKLYLTFHSFGNWMLHPWGFTEDLPTDSEELFELGTKVSDAIVAAGGEPYKVGSSTNLLYAAAGGSDDWMKGVGGVELSYCVELPHGGNFGINPPASRIKQIVSETFEGIKVFHDYIQANKSDVPACARDLFSSKKELEEPKRIRVYLDDDEVLLVPKNAKIEYINPVIELAEVPNTADQVEIAKKNLPPATVPVGQQSVVQQYYADQQPYYQQQYYGQSNQYETGYQSEHPVSNGQPYSNYITQQYKTIQNYGNFGNQQQYVNDDYSTLPNDYQGYNADFGHNSLDYGEKDLHSDGSQIRIDGIPPKFRVEDLKLTSNALHYGGFRGGVSQRGGHVALPSLKDSPIAYGKLLKPILLLPNGYIRGVDLEKPVEEDQSGDLKYDFRTKTHSLK